MSLIAVTTAVPAIPQAAGALQRLEPGLWELRDLSDESRLRASVCLGDPMLLAQAQHGAAPCTRNVISSNPRSTTVHYTCPSAGFGRTTIRFETARLAQVDSQGIHRHAPFAFHVEARRVGPCRQMSASRR